MKIDWVKKLTSRKFWVAVVGFVTPMLLAFGIAEDVVTQVAAIIMACATLIAYIIGEGLIDANSASNVPMVIDDTIEQEFLEELSNGKGDD